MQETVPNSVLQKPLLAKKINIEPSFTSAVGCKKILLETERFLFGEIEGRSCLAGQRVFHQDRLTQNHAFHGA